MSEITKLYKNAGIKKCSNNLKKYKSDVCLLNGNIYGRTCNDCMWYHYPSFTAEKQIELIKFIYIKYKKYEMFKVSNRDEVGIRASENTFYAYGIDIQNAMANFFNRNWQDLTEEEKQQVKGILE